MSFADRVVLWLHIAVAIFTIGPVTLAISSTPRYIRRGDMPVLRYLARITLMFTIGSLLVFVLGVILGDLDSDFAHPWLTVAMTLFVVAIVLLAMIVRDQRRAIRALAPAAEAGGDAAAGRDGNPVSPDEGPVTDAGPGREPAAAAAPGAGHVASVERGRIAALGGIVNLIWLVILALMVWRP